LEGLAYV